MQQPPANNPVLLYDGVCGLCNKSVQMILDHDKRKEMRFAALQSDYGKQVVSRHPELEKVDSIVFVEQKSEAGDERVFIRSDAALRVASYLGGAWKLLLIFRIIPTPIRDFFYNLCAKYRYKFFGKYDSCMLPAPDVRSRFLDVA